MEGSVIGTIPLEPGAIYCDKGKNITPIEDANALETETLMPLFDVQIHEFIVLWKKATGEDISSEEARQNVARLIHLYRVLVHRIPIDRTPNAERYRPAEIAAQLTPESS